MSNTLIKMLIPVSTDVLYRFKFITYVGSGHLVAPHSARPINAGQRQVSTPSALRHQMAGALPTQHPPIQSGTKEANPSLHIEFVHIPISIQTFTVIPSPLAFLYPPILTLASGGTSSLGLGITEHWAGMSGSHTRVASSCATVQ